MNPRKLVNFFKTPTGKFAGFGILLIIGLALAHHFHKPTSAKPLPLTNSTSAAPSKVQLVESVTKNMSPYRPPKLSATRASAAVNSANRNKQKPLLAPISLFSDVTPDKAKTLSKFYAPFGRLIPCELIVTVDSSSIRTPIIGLITEDVYFAGRLIIPAGTEVHGVAQVDRSRERIASGNRWTLVFQDGEELTLNGLALDRETDTNGVAWGITDGSAGLRGRVLKTDDLAEIKLFAASFLSGAASAFTQNRQTVLGTEVLPTAKNAGLEGAQSVIQAYAQQIYDSIQRDGFYVRVSAGKQFYVYITQTLDVSDARIGGTRFAADEFAQTNSATPNARNYFPPNAAALYRNGAIP
jgi:hypothetical protein